MSYFPDRSGPSYRPLNLFGLALCAGALAFAVLYLQDKLGTAPCPLCTLTRFLLVVQGLLFLLALLHNPRQLGQRAYALLGLLISGAGIALNLRHAWLQRLPAGQADCGTGLDDLLEVLPLRDAFQGFLGDSGACAPFQGELLGLTLPEQSLLLFTLLALVLLRLFRKPRQRNYFS